MNVPHQPDFLAGLRHSGMKLGLENMRHVCAALGHPERGLRFVHLAGTNGKGSCAALLESALRACGHGTGLFTSPHLVRFRERIRVGGEPITEERLQGHLERLRPVVEQMRGRGMAPTFFEAVTALGLMEFASRGVELAVWETGLGGRLDATNVVEPELAAVTGIGLDHMEYLGPTPEDIAREKAGIFKKGRPALAAGGLPEGVRAVLRREAQSRGAIFQEAPPAESWEVCGFPPRQRVRSHGGVWETGLLGAHQAANLALVLESIAILRQAGWHLPEEGVRRGLEAAEWPARFQILQAHPSLVLDGAHNPQGVETALRTWEGVFGGAPGRIYFGCVRDKDAAGMASLIEATGAEVVLVRMRWERGLELADLRACFRRAPVLMLEDPESAWREAQAAAGGGLILGSLYLAGEFLAARESLQPDLAWQ